MPTSSMNAIWRSISQSASAAVAIRAAPGRCGHVVDRGEHVLAQANAQPARAPGELLPFPRERIAAGRRAHTPWSFGQSRSEIGGERRGSPRRRFRR